MICAIVLAAGESRRMGTQKLLLPVAGRTMIVHVVCEVVQAAAVEQVLVVTGMASHTVRAALASAPVTHVTNTLPDGDMLSSIRCGVSALPLECLSVFIVPGDQPGINTGLIAEMVEVQKLSQKSIVAPVCQGRRGHPVLLSMRFRDEILTHHGGTGLRGLLDAHPGDIAEVAVDDPRMLQDVDVPEDYARLTGHPL